MLSHGFSTSYSVEKAFPSEVVDFENPDALCSLNVHQEYPSLSSASAGLLDGSIPMVCGGENHDTLEVGIDCYMVGKPEPVFRMTQRRYRPGYVVIKSRTTLWITGGYDPEVIVKVGLRRLPITSFSFILDSRQKTNSKLARRKLFWILQSLSQALSPLPDLT